jgi:hypothetical protein
MTPALAPLIRDKYVAGAGLLLLALLVYLARVPRDTIRRPRPKSRAPVEGLDTDENG